VSCIRSLKFGDTGEKVILAACGRESSLVATNHGSLYSFGSNRHCQLALESKDDKSIHPEPVKIPTVPSKRTWKQIGMGAEHACALTSTGEVFVWGSNEDGQCGQDEKHQTIKRPQELRINAPVKAM
jgi:alpha-tubulin suppressor-like RCC1 family protein